MIRIGDNSRQDRNLVFSACRQCHTTTEMHITAHKRQAQRSCLCVLCGSASVVLALTPFRLFVHVVNSLIGKVDGNDNTRHDDLLSDRG